MADHVNQVYTNDAIPSENTFGIKEEQCQEDSFLEDKVCISETVITIDNPDMQGHIWHCKIEQHEQPTCLNNIKIELASHEVTEVQKGTIDRGISADDVKIKFDNGLLYCENCEAYYVDYCIGCGMLVNILNKNTLNSADNGAPADIPNDILEIQDRFGQTRIYALRTIPAGVKFGPFTGLSTPEGLWEMEGETFVLDKNKSQYLNWMQYINPTRNTSERNLHIVQSEDNIYYQSTRQIQAGEKLLVYVGEEYGSSPNKVVGVEFATTTEDISKDIFACTFCCLGFSSKLLLVKHKTVCVENTAGKFSIEELTQCPFCKIHLNRKEFYEHHMSFCSERNARKSILPTPSAKQVRTALNGPNRCFRQIYKCEHCKYRTKYQADLKKHTNNNHYEVKMHSCRICFKRFKTKESLTLHAENTHAYVVGKDGRKHSMTNYRNAHIKIEQSSSRNQKGIFKCSLCVFQTKYKQSLRRHIKDKHLNQLDFKCDKCEYETNLKRNLEKHIKIKHVKKFDYKCDLCEFITNDKRNLKVHIKTKHLQKFDYKCDKCEYGTNNKSNLERHIKCKHLKQIDYKCDSCEFETHYKTNLERHIESKHLKKNYYKCDSCEYGTNYKSNLKVHIKTKHLKKIDYKCDSCEYGTSFKNSFKVHIKTKHLQIFDYKCDSCEYRTNNKTSLKRHIKSKH